MLTATRQVEEWWFNWAARRFDRQLQDSAWQVPQASFTRAKTWSKQAKLFDLGEGFEGSQDQTLSGSWRGGETRGYSHGNIPVSESQRPASPSWPKKILRRTPHQDWHFQRNLAKRLRCPQQALGHEQPRSKTRLECDDQCSRQYCSGSLIHDPHWWEDGPLHFGQDCRYAKGTRRRLCHPKVLNCHFVKDECSELGTAWWDCYWEYYRLHGQIPDDPMVHQTFAKIQKSGPENPRFLPRLCFSPPCQSFARQLYPGTNGVEAQRY